eukprot:6211317-Pleurochrysis_carterae.AAC.2
MNAGIRAWGSPPPFLGGRCMPSIKSARVARRVLQEHAARAGTIRRGSEAPRLSMHAHTHGCTANCVRGAMLLCPRFYIGCRVALGSQQESRNV